MRSSAGGSATGVVVVGTVVVVVVATVVAGAVAVVAMTVRAEGARHSVRGRVGGGRRRSEPETGLYFGPVIREKVIPVLIIVHVLTCF